MFVCKIQPLRAKLLRCHAAASELRQLARRFTVTYSDDMADIYLSSKTAMAILHVITRFFSSLSFSDLFKHFRSLVQRWPVILIEEPTHPLFRP